MSSGGFGSLPSFASDDDKSLSPSVHGWLQDQQLAQAQNVGGTSQDVPPATPPGFTGYNPPTPPTGAPTGVVQPQAQGLGAAAMSALGPSSTEAATPDPTDVRSRFIGTLQDGGLTNPNGLGAVAAYAQHESRYSPSNITGSWSDPSQSGQPGTSGGILSWRGDRLDNMRTFTQGAADPVVAQAKFLLQENPQLTQSLQNARSPQEAHNLMADAWKFAGYNRPGGENAARLATTQAYASSFGGGQALPGMGGSGSSPQISPGIARPAGTSMGSTAMQGGFGIGGVVGQGPAVPGQASPTPDVAALSGQPLTATGTPMQPQNSYYGNIANALGAVKLQQQQGQKVPQKMKMAQPYRPNPISLQQAQAMFDPGKFYGMLRSAGVGGQSRGS